MRELSVFEVKHVSGGSGVVLGQASSGSNTVSIKASGDVTSLLPGKQPGIVIEGTFSDLGSFMQDVGNLLNDAISNIGDRIEGLMEHIMDAVSDLFSRMADWIKNVFTPESPTP